jgi:pimeloyl-ACP methyl ester carboxylesterase
MPKQATQVWYVTGREMALTRPDIGVSIGRREQSAVEVAPQETAPPLAPEDHVVRLADGRELGFRESGDPNGRPALFFHGFGTSRVICPPDDEARRRGIRLIAVDRPGIGLSEPSPGRRLLDWPIDVGQLADKLDLSTFSVIGWSGGGPYALACGFALADRVNSVAAVSSPAPLAGNGEADYLRRMDKHAARAAGRWPWVIRLAMWHWGRPQRRDAARFFEESVADMCAFDQEVLAAPELRDRMIANSAELYRQGGRGMYDEALVLARPWDFHLGDIRVPVHVWHGANDDTVPIAMGRYLARSIPSATATFDRRAGHQLVYGRWPEILAAVR